ncbi:uncharacterized protein [Dysidea avara]|uniref:uncharacterized protein isoform X3 n=1 Tax=Dysidea avara TaxID=196820 RepID=UPI003319CFE7
MASLRPRRAMALASKDACDHAVVRFDEEEGCTSVVEDFRIQSDIKKLSEGDSCIVLWDDGVLYPATFVMAGSKDCCNKKEDELLNDEEKENRGVKQNVTKEKAVVGRKLIDTNEAQSMSEEIGRKKTKRRRKRKLIQVNNNEDKSMKHDNEAGRMGKQQPQKTKNETTKKGKQKQRSKKAKQDDDDFILKVGEAPIQEIPMNEIEMTSDDLDTWNDIIIDQHKNVDDEYSEDDIEHTRDSFGAVNKEIVVPMAMDSSDRERDRSVHHYTGGRQQELDIHELKKELKIESTEQKKSLVELNSTVGKLTKAVEDSQKTLASILTKMFNPTDTISVGFNSSSVQVPSPTECIMIPPSHQSSLSPLTTTAEPYQGELPPNAEENMIPPSHESTIAEANPTIDQGTNVTVPVVITPNSVRTPPTPNRMVPAGVLLDQGTNATDPIAVNPNSVQPLVRTPPTPTCMVSVQGTNAMDPIAVTPNSVQCFVRNPPTPACLVPDQGTNATDPTPNSVRTPPTPNRMVPVPMPTTALSNMELTSIYNTSCSRRNFSVNLVRRLFTVSVRCSSNVSGKGRKSQLNPQMIQYIRSLTFQFFPLQGYENERKEWAACVVSIDESCRRLINKPSRQQPPQ